MDEREVVEAAGESERERAEETARERGGGGGGGRSELCLSSRERAAAWRGEREWKSARGVSQVWFVAGRLLTKLAASMIPSSTGWLQSIVNLSVCFRFVSFFGLACGCGGGRRRGAQLVSTLPGRVRQA